MSKRKRLAPDERAAQILDAAVKLAVRTGWRRLTRDSIATSAKISTGLVSAHFGSMDNLRDEVMRAAVSRRILSIVREGIADRNKIANAAPADLRREALRDVAA